MYVQTVLTAGGGMALSFTMSGWGRIVVFRVDRLGQFPQLWKTNL